MDPDTGIVLEAGHPLQGQSIAGKVLVFPTGKGSTVGSYTLLRLQRAGSAPVAIINAESEAIVAVGAIISDIPMVDQVDLSVIHNDDWVEVHDDVVTVTPGDRRAGMSAKDPARPLVFLETGRVAAHRQDAAQSRTHDVLHRLADEIAAAQAERPAMRLLIGHGSGSFGHVTAGRYQTRRGVATPEQWAGYAETARVAAELNRQVVQALGEAGAAALPIQPSASAYCRDGELTSLQIRPIRTALSKGLIPVIYGDVALDAVRGGTIVSTEELFAYLAPRLHAKQIVLAGEVAGVMTADPTRNPDARLIPLVTPATLPEIANLLGGSRGTDVTGGMAAKVAEMAALLQTAPTINVIHIISGLEPGLVRKALTDAATGGGTRIVRDASNDEAA